ncbi:homeodomain-containing protein [Fusarium bulbicola]|nr:homeodomain-containing protein [Fusarium bulbicola]
MPPDRSWGSSQVDYRVREGKKRPLQSPSTRIAKKKKVSHRQQPISYVTNEYHEFMAGLAVEADLYLEQDEEQGQEQQDMVDEDEASNQDENLPPLPQTMSLAHFDVLINEMEKACGQAPTMDARKSFRTRAALGQRKQQTLFKILETNTLTQSGAEVPNIIGIYMIHGIPAGADAADESKHQAYCGQAMALKPMNNNKSVGIQQRPLHVHRRLSEAKVDKVEVAVLSAFPCPHPEMGDVLLHLPYIASLAETVDILLTDSICDTSARAFGPHAGLPQGFLLQTEHIPRRSFEGLNRALPIKQSMNVFGHLVASMTWSLPDIKCLMHIIEQNEDRVYLHFQKKTIQWDFIVKELRANSIYKTVDEVMSIYDVLRRDPDSGLLTCRASLWRLIWREIWRVKQHLCRKGLVQPPKDENDIYYHIPSLEDCLETNWHIHDLLKRTGFSSSHEPIYRAEFFRRNLTRLLQRDVWENIEEVAPDRLVALSYMMPRNVRRRVADVFLHFAAEVSIEQGICINPPPATIPAMSIDNLTLVWHRVRAQMLADGVPPELSLFGGLNFMKQLWKENKRRLYDPCCSHTLQLWTYEPPEAVACKEPLSSQQASANHAQDRWNQVGEDIDLIENHDHSELELEAEYVWPSDRDRDEALASTHKFIAVGADLPTEEVKSILVLPIQHGAPVETAQHRCSSLRVLSHIMRKWHQNVFESAEATYEQFWETLWVAGLDEKWKIRDIPLLIQRFGWVLKFIETGVLPLEAQIARELLWEALKDNVLSCPTHPYNSNAAKADSWLINPDLSQVWVKKFLKANGSLDRVKNGLQARMPDMGIGGFCNTYGILGTGKAANLKEPLGRRWRPHGDGELQKSGHATLFDGKLIDPSPTTDHSFGTDDSEGSASPHLLPQSSFSVPPTSPLYSPLDKKATQDGGRSWQAEEDEHLRYLLQTYSSKAAQIEKYQEKFGLHRTEAAIVKRPTDLAKDMPLAKERKKRMEWTANEKQYLTKVLPTCKAWSELHSKMQENFGNNRPLLNIQKCVYKLKLDTSALVRQLQWTDEQDDYLKSLIENGTPTKELPSLFEKKFGFRRTLRSLQSRVTTKQMTGCTHEAFTEEEEQYIKGLLPLGLTLNEVYNRFCKEFGSCHPIKSVGGKMTRLSTDSVVSSKEKRIPWTEEELQFLEDWSHPRREGKKALVNAFQGKFGPKRTALAINTKYSIVKARKEKEQSPEGEQGDA